MATPAIHAIAEVIVSVQCLVKPYCGIFSILKFTASSRLPQLKHGLLKSCIIFLCLSAQMQVQLADHRPSFESAFTTFEILDVPIYS